ncbi:hypothetical protein [Methylobacterium radiodurans]|uniref:Uncharacterized protein n=1 Tax=Methylobacterium radiodurans TaxID=2202828 RepID=A0A2U8VVF3_9HYPH|nr:hypothetical protein [Methylobacterium radiodurans]AWN37717.1 hypothetical protein DK427_19930 [Methylobacterium radiodurans]
MRSLLLLPVLLTLSSTPGEAKADTGTTDLPALERTWHACVRGAFVQHSLAGSKLAAQLSALDECREHEDVYVAALMATRIAEDEARWMRDRPVPSTAAAWLETVTSHVVYPVSYWLGGRKRSRIGSGLTQ